MNLGAVLLTGLFAGGVSCAAVQGGLLAGLVTRQRDAATSESSTPVKRSGKPGRTALPPKPLRERLADDLTPVGGFLAGKLVSHTLLGLLLGAIGGAVPLSPGVRAWTQLAAGGLVIVFGLAQLGVGGFKSFTVEPPAAWSRFVRGRARSQAAFAPAVLGFCTVLIPCGITLSVEALALTSGSAWAGAATMAVFVLGTGPLFAVLGYAARKAATAWKGRLAVATGLIVLGMGLYTVNGGLTLMDSPLAASNLAQRLGLSTPPAVSDTVTVDAGSQVATVTAGPHSYTPGNIALKAGIPTTLVVRSENNDGCTRAFVIRGQQYVLPENGDTRIDLGVLQAGELRYRCAMGMYSGRLTITG